MVPWAVHVHEEAKVARKEAWAAVCEASSSEKEESAETQKELLVRRRTTQNIMAQWQMSVSGSKEALWAG